MREVLRRDPYRGVQVWGATKRTVKGGRKTRLRGADVERDVTRVAVPELQIVTDELWTAAHARIAATRARLDAEGRLKGDVTNTRGKHPLSGLLVCGLWLTPAALDAFIAERR